MNVAKLQELIPASFEYVYLDAQDVEQKELIELKLKRIAFNKASSQGLRRAVEEEDTEAMSAVLEDIIAEWNLDVDGAEFAPIAANIGACPAEFVAQICKTVFQRLNANPPKANDSDNGLEPPAALA